MGISRLFYATFIVAAISVGLLFTLSLLNVSLPVDESGRAVPLFIDVPAAGVAAWAYSVFYSTPWRLMGFPILVGMFVHAARYETLAAGGSVVLATLFAALIAGSILAPIAYRFRIPFAAVGFASVVSMLPGVFLLRMASGLFCK